MKHLVIAGVLLNCAVNLAMAVPGDSCSVAVEVTEGTHTAPQAPYWYKFTMPPGDQKLVISSVGLTAEDTYLIVFDTCDGNPLAYSDDYDEYQSQITLYTLEAGQMVYIYWSDSYSSAEFDWALSVEDIQTGETCSDPVPADSGNNIIPATPYWYTYTVEENDKKIILSSIGTTQVDTYVAVFDSCGGEMLAFSDDYSTSQSQVELFDLTAGQTIYIFWSDYSEPDGFIWTLSVADPEPGDMCNLAKTIDQGVHESTEAPFWYRYIVPENDKRLKISSVGLTMVDTYVIVFESCEGGIIAENDDVVDGVQSEVNIYDARKGDTLYILWADAYSSEGFNWKLELLDIPAISTPAGSVEYTVVTGNTGQTNFSVSNEGIGLLEAEVYSSQSLSFEGTNAFAWIPYSDDFFPAEAITITLWIYLDEDLDCNAGNNYRILLTTGFSDWGTGYDVILEQDRHLTWSMATAGGPTRYYGSGGQVPVGEWTHLAFTYDASLSEAGIFINGTEISGTYWEQGSGSIENNYNDLRINFIVDEPCMEGPGNFPGKLDNLGIWSDVRTPGEILDEMWSPPVQGVAPGLAAFWDFEAVDQGRFRDLTDNQHDGYISNAMIRSVSPYNWLMISPSSMTLNAMEEGNFNLTFNAGELASRKYSTRFVIKSNDPWEELLAVPVTLNVVQSLGNEDPLGSGKGLNLMASPNPFKVETSIFFTLEHPARITLSWYDSRGALVEHIDQDYVTGGMQTITWKGSLRQPGIYICHLKVNYENGEHRSALIKLLHSGE